MAINKEKGKVNIAVGKADSAGHRHQKKSISLWLQRIGIWATVLGVVISGILSGWAVRLTQKYGESRDQLNALSRITTAQYAEQASLRAILSKTTAALAKSDSLITAVNTTNKQLFSQNGLLSKQLLLSDSEHKANNAMRILQIKVDSQKFMQALFSDIHSTSAITAGNSVKPSKSDRVAYLSLIERILSSQMDNKYLLSNKLWDNVWNSLYFDCNSALYDQEQTKVGEASFVNGKWYTTRMSDDGVEKLQLDSYNKVLDHWVRLQLYISGHHNLKID